MKFDAPLKLTEEGEIAFDFPEKTETGRDNRAVPEMRQNADEDAVGGMNVCVDLRSGIPLLRWNFPKK